MRTCLSLIGFLIFCAACGSRNKNSVTLPGPAVTDSTAAASLAGNWIATSATYALLTSMKYKNDTVFLDLRADSSFNAHLPDCLDAAVKGGVSWDAIGTWKVFKDAGNWKLGMSFVAGRLFRYRTFTTFDLVLIDSQLTISRYVGNPDKDQALQFSKSE